MRHLLLILFLLCGGFAQANIIRVTSVANTGLGTLRDAVENVAVPSDTILIDVRGDIELLTPVLFDGLSNVTLIGPTAKHCFIKAASGFTGSNLFEIQNTNSLYISQVAFIGVAGIGVRAVNINSCAGPIRFEGVLFKGFSNSFNGGAMSVLNSTAQVQNCSFVNNNSLTGGAISTSGSSVIIENTTFWNNTSANQGGAVYVESGTDIDLIHNTFHENTSSISSGHAFFSNGATNTIFLQSNAISNNGLGPSQFSGGGVFTSAGGNVFRKNTPPDTQPWGLIGSDVSATALNFNYKATIVEDGFGLMYFTIINQSSALVDVGPATGLQMDGRKAPRALKSFNGGPAAPDAGACEYTPLRVTSSGGSSGTANTLPWVFEPAQNFNTINYVEFDLATIPVTLIPTSQMTLQGNYIVDGFSQSGSAVPGPATEGTPGVTPAILPVSIANFSTILYGFHVLAVSTTSTIRGMRILLFDQYGIYSQGQNTVIEGCEFGINEVDASAGNDFAGIVVNANNNRIGGRFHYQRNVLSGNGTGGGANPEILVNTLISGTKIFGNIIGLNRSGTDFFTGSNSYYGIYDLGTQTTIGEVDAGNLISAKTEGITCVGCSDLEIYGNTIGLDYNQTQAKSNITGIFIHSSATNVKIGKTGTGGGNLISGNVSVQVRIDQVNGISLKNNFIGPTKDGIAAPVTTTHGIYISHLSANNIVVGGTSPNDKNIISGNQNGIYVNQVGTGCQIISNYIGLNKDGNAGLPNSVVGIVVQGGVTNTIQIGIPGAGNVVSGQGLAGGVGIAIVSAAPHTIQSNIIGLDATGTNIIQNIVGISLTASSGVQIGGDASLNEGNVISGNENGIAIQLGSNNTVIQGNLIGTDITGTLAKGNVLAGITVQDGVNTTIGGGGGFRNVISGSTNPGSSGISLQSTGSGTTVLGNFIGSDFSGNIALGNDQGIIVQGSHQTFIGGLFPNFITSSTQAGITISTSGATTVDGNSIGISSSGETTGMSNLYGVLVLTPNAVIGDSYQNIIVNSVQHGIFVSGENADGALINNNIIGTDAANTLGIGNAVDGIRVFDADFVMIGTLTGNTIIGNNDAGIRLTGTVTSTEIRKNTITDFSNSGLTNNIGIYIDGGATLNIIGNTYANGNTIGDNLTDGILVENSPNNTIIGNCIGSDGTATAMPNQNGIRIFNSAGTVIGDENVLGNGTFNVISGNTNAGILLDNSSSSLIRSNIIGLNETGNSQIPNLNGIVVVNGSTANDIGGNGNPVHRNTISGNSTSGIYISSPFNNVTFNFIGLTQDGSTFVTGQDYGVILDPGATGCTIGGDRPTQGNIISGNEVSGILVLDQDNQILGNIFGYSSSNGIVGLQPIGIELGSASAIGNLIGAVPAGGNEFGNIIMNHSTAGINIHSGAAGNFITGNYIGIDPSNITTSTQAVGVEVESSAGIDNVIGEDVVDGGNVISGNTVGIRLDGSVHTLIYNNRIGTNIAGTGSASNSATGIHISNASFNTVGGSGLKSNVISGNTDEGILIEGTNSTDNIVSGNVIGINAGLTAVSSNLVGIEISGGANNNFIGVSGAGLGNLICGNSLAGIIVSGANSNLISNNRIGVLFPNKHGIIFQSGSTNNTLGGSIADRNIISKNDSIGVALNSVNSNSILGNFIGTDVNGNVALPNLIGVFVLGGASNIIGTSASGNLVSANTIAGIFLESTALNSVQNNFIGTDSSGNSIFAGSQNGLGLVIKNSSNNLVGGDNSLGEENVICNSSSSAVYFENATLNTMYGNKIGISKNGLTYLPNSGEGIRMHLGSNNNQIGFPSPNFENSIAANTKGMWITDSHNNTIENNFIGNNTTGTSSAMVGLNNQQIGIHIDSSSTGNQISSANVISGNDVNGILITGTETKNNYVQGNFIGVDINGVLSLPNGVANIRIADSAKFTFIGGTVPADRNYLGGNIPTQILIDNAADSNQVLGNFIGLGLDETTTYTSNNGVLIQNNSKFNIIGGGIPGAGNTIVGFDLDGIHIQNSNNNSVLGNRIGIKPDNSAGAIDSAGVLLDGADNTWIGAYLVGSDSINVITNCNAGVEVTTFPILNSSYGNVIGGNAIYNNINQGIDLIGDDQVMPIDTNNANIFIDNGGMDRPEIVSAWTCGSDGFTHVGFKFYASNALPNYHIEFYTNPVPDGSGYGEGEIFIGDFTFSPATNYDTITINLGQTLPVGTIVTATVTGVWGNTSEFSEQFAVSLSPIIGSPMITDETCLGAANGFASVVAVDAYAFSWDGGITWEYGNGSITSVLPSGTYMLDALYLNGCTASIPVALSDGPPLAFGYSLIPDTCGLGVGQMLIDTASTNAAGGSGDYIYSFNGGSVYLGSIDSIGVSAGTYSIGLNDTTLGCFSNLDVVVVNEITDVEDESFVFDDFCSDAIAVPVSVATAGGVFTFETTPGDGALINSATGLISGGVVGNSYDVIYTVGVCDEKDTISVTVLDNDDASFTISDFCVGSPQSVIVTGLVGGTFSFDPVPGDGAVIDPVTGIISGSGGSSYTVKYVTNGPCPDSLSVNVNVFAQPGAPDIFATDSIFCDGETIAVLTVGPGIYTPNWMIGSPTSTVLGTVTNFTPASLNYGDNWIYLVLSDGGTCVSAADSINYFLSDVSSLSAGADMQTCLASEVQLSATGGIQYAWSVNDNLSDLAIADPIALVDGEDYYIVTITDAYGCTKTDSVHVTLLPLAECNVDSYNAFSPNSDGTNDLWIIDGIEGYSENVVTVYNRWGDILIQFDDYNNTTVIWDGTNSAGKEVVSGTYFFVIDVNGTQNQTGWVQVVR